MATLIYTNDWTNGIANVVQMMPPPEGITDTYTVIDAPSRPGIKACRNYIPANDPGRIEYDGNTLKHRALLAHNGTSLNNLYTFATGIEYWVGFGFYLPSGYPVSSSNGIYAFDWQVGSGFFEISAIIRSGYLTIDRGWVNTSSNQQHIYTVNNLQLLTWYNIVFRFIRNPTTAQPLQIWVNGTQVVDITWTCNDYASVGVNPPYFRTGIYWSQPSRPDPYTTIWTPVRIATGTNGFALVDPTQGSSTPPIGNGSISVTSDNGASSINLTSLGTTDWAHFGLTSVDDFNTKSNGPNLITNLTGSKLQTTGTAIATSWSDGTPITIANNITACNRTNTSASFTVASNTVSKKLQLFIDVKAAKVTFLFHLNDGSATDQSIVFDEVNTGSHLHSITCTFSSATTTQLVVTATINTQYVTGGNVQFAGVIIFPDTTIPTGILTGTLISQPSSVNLSQYNDWIHYGLVNSTSVNRKANVTQQIGNLALIGAPTVNRFSPNNTPVNWTDGTPTLAGNSVESEIYITALNTGFQITANSSTNTKTLYILFKAYSSKVQIDATLADGSAAAYQSFLDDPSSAGLYRLLTINFKSDVSSILTVKLTLITVYAVGGTGNLALQAIYLTDPNSLALALNPTDPSSTYKVGTTVPQITINVSGGVTPNTFTAVGLPNGLTLAKVSDTQATINGTITTPNNWANSTYISFVKVTDSQGKTVESNSWTTKIRPADGPKKLMWHK